MNLIAVPIHATSSFMCSCLKEQMIHTGGDDPPMQLPHCADSESAQSVCCRFRSRESRIALLMADAGIQAASCGKV